MSLKKRFFCSLENAVNIQFNRESFLLKDPQDHSIIDTCFYEVKIRYETDIG